MLRYCPQCGQAAPSPDDYSIRAHAADLFEQVTSTDGKTARTLWTLITKPGALTIGHLEGQRARYLKPIQLFLLVNVLLFITAPQVPLFSYNLEKYLRYAPPSASLVNTLVKKVTPAGHTHDAARGGNEFAAFQARFDARVDAQRKSLIILFAPALALLLSVLTRRRQEHPAPRVYGEHLVFCLHLLTWIWLILAAVGAIARIAAGILDPNSAATVLLIATVTLVLIAGSFYVVIAVRRVYNVSWGKAGGLFILIAAGFTGLLVLYRGLLFFTTYYTL